MWKHIQGMSIWINSKISSFVSNKITGPIKKVLKISSPSGLTEEYGEDTAEGLIVGTENKESDVAHASEKLAETIASPSEQGIVRTRPQQQTTSTVVNNKFHEMKSRLVELIQDVKEG